MSCLGCQRCESESTKMIKLDSGSIVCDTCPEYLAECDARHWINYAKTNGQTAWKKQKEALLKKRGTDGLQKLVEKMEQIR